MKFLFKVGNLFCLGLFGVLDFLEQKLSDFPSQGFSPLCEGRKDRNLGVGRCVVDFPEKLAQLLDVNAFVPNVVLEGLDQAAHGGGFQENGMHVDTLAEEPQIVCLPAFMKQIEYWYLLYWDISNACSGREALPFDQFAQEVWLFPILGGTNGGVNVDVVRFPSYWAGW